MRDRGRKPESEREREREREGGERERDRGEMEERQREASPWFPSMGMLWRQLSQPPYSTNPTYTFSAHGATNVGNDGGDGRNGRRGVAVTFATSCVDGGPDALNGGGPKLAFNDADGKKWSTSARRMPESTSCDDDDDDCSPLAV